MTSLLQLKRFQEARRKTSSQETATPVDGVQRQHNPESLASYFGTSKQNAAFDVAFSQAIPKSHSNDEVAQNAKVREMKLNTDLFHDVVPSCDIENK